MSALDLLKPFVKFEVEDYICLSHDIDEQTVLSKDLSLLTVIEVEGLMNYAGVGEWDTAHLEVFNGINQLLGNAVGHEIHWVFESDPAQVNAQLNDTVKSSLVTAERIGLDVRDIAAENAKVLARHVSVENNYVAIWTDLRALAPEDKKLLKDAVNSFETGLSIENRAGSAIGSVSNSMQQRHKSAVEVVEGSFHKANIAYKVLSPEEFGSVLYKQIYKDVASDSWRLVTSKDQLRQKQSSPGKYDYSDLIHSPFSAQIAAFPSFSDDPLTVNIGGKYARTVQLELMPRTFVRFNEFMKGAGIMVPYRISMKMFSGTDWFEPIRRTILTFSAFLKKSNKDISAQLGRYMDASIRKGTVSVSLTTWADDKKVLEKNTNKLIRCLQGWGESQVNIDKSNALELFMETCIGTRMGSACTKHFVDLADFSIMLPFDRPARVWGNGLLGFYTPCGKQFNWLPATTRQNPHIELNVARSRNGKSVLANSINFAFGLRPGGQSLPFLASIDCGPSAVGLFNFIANRLPEKEAHKVITWRMTLDDVYVNIFDTQLFCHRPMPHEREFITSMLLVMLTPNGKAEPEYDFTPLIDVLINEVYDNASEGNQVETYRPGISQDIDAKLTELNFEQAAKTSWWDVVEFLGEKGEYKDASDAQKFAVPTLNDFQAMAEKSPIVQRRYGTSHGGDFLDVFRTRLIEAISSYGFLTKPTNINFDQAKWVNIDVKQVLSTDELLGPKRNSIMYGLAAHLAAGRFMLNHDCLKYVPQKWVGYHSVIIDELTENQARIHIDELHRTNGNKGLLRLLDVYCREAAKSGINIAFSSQEIGDFSDAMTKMATTVNILGSPRGDEIDEISKRLRLPESAVKVLESGMLHGPTNGGSCFMMVYELKERRNFQVLRFPKAISELWIHCTNLEDIAIKDKLSKKLPYDQAMMLLGRMFPKGSASELIEFRREQAEASGEPVSVVSQIVEEALQEHERTLVVKTI